MALETITKDTIKGAALRELQGLKCVVADGANTATNIAVAGATVKRSTLVAVIHEDGTSGVSQANLLAETSITSDGNIQLTTTDTTGDKLLVWFYDKAA